MLTRVVDFTGLPLFFAEDFEVLEGGEYLWSGINEVLPGGEDLFQRPFFVTRFFPKKQ